MTETIALPENPVAESPHIARPETDNAALRAIDEAAAQVRERALAIRRNPEAHKPKLVLSRHVRGTSILDRIADGVNKFCGSMYVFIAITVPVDEEMPGISETNIPERLPAIIETNESR